MKNIFFNKKLILTTLLTASSLTLTNIAWADDKTPTQQSAGELPSNITNSINADVSSLKKRVTQLFYLGFKTVNQNNNQTNPNMASIEKANTATQRLTGKENKTLINPSTGQPYQNTSQLVASDVEKATQNTVNNNLTQLVYATRPFSNTSTTITQKLRAPELFESNLGSQNPTIGFHQYMLQNSTAVLSGIQPNTDTSITTTNNIMAGFGNNQAGIMLPNYSADDTLHAGSATTDAVASKQNLLKYLKKPTNPQNNMLNFSSVITPSAYTQSELENAQKYLKFSTLNTANLYPSTLFHFKELSESTLLANPQERANAIYNLKESPAFQRFKLSMRNYIALNSIPIGIINQLIKERTPVKGLGTQAGLKNDNASPLQVEAYIANHRIQDKSWYASVQSATPATLQRKTLIILAEMEHQNYEAHLDREHLLSAMSALTLTLQHSGLKTQMEESAQKVNTAIKKAIDNATNANQGSPSDANNNSNTEQNNADNQYEDQYENKQQNGNNTTTDNKK